MNRFVLPLNSPQATDPDRVGPKTAHLAVLARAGLPTPGGFCLTAGAYRHQIATIGLVDALVQYGAGDPGRDRRLSAEIRLSLIEQPIAPEIIDEALLPVWHSYRETISKGQWAVRSSALIEDRADAHFAGQFTSVLGIDSDEAFLGAVRSCWAALWTAEAGRYMASNGLNPAATAMGVLIQPMIASIAAGSGLSRTAEGNMMLSAARASDGPDGALRPERILLSRDGRPLENARQITCEVCGRGGPARRLSGESAGKPVLVPAQANELGRHLRKCEEVLQGPVEIEWVLDQKGFRLLQARPLNGPATLVPDEIWLAHPQLSGAPAGSGSVTGRAAVVHCACDLSRVAPGDILITSVAGAALDRILPQVAGVVAERGDTGSNLASRARASGIPAVLGVSDATATIPDGAQVAVDGVAGTVRWIA